MQSAICDAGRQLLQQLQVAEAYFFQLAAWKIYEPTKLSALGFASHFNLYLCESRAAEEPFFKIWLKGY